MTGIRNTFEIKPMTIEMHEKGPERFFGEIIEGKIIEKSSEGTKVQLMGQDVMVDQSVGIVEDVGGIAKFEVVTKTTAPPALKYLRPPLRKGQGSSFDGESPVKRTVVQKDYRQLLQHSLKRLPEEGKQRVAEMVDSAAKSLTATVDYLTDKDVQQMMRDGLNVEKTSIEIVARVLKHHKMTLLGGNMEAVEKDVEEAVASMKKDYANEPQLKRIITALKAADLPIKKKHVDKVQNGLDKVQQIKSMDSEAAVKLLKGDFDTRGTVTLSKVYKTLSGVDVKAMALPVSDQELEQLVKDRLIKEGIPVSRESMKAAKALVRQGIDLTHEKIAFATAPQEVTSKISEETMIRTMVRKIANKEEVNDCVIKAFDFLKKEGLPSKMGTEINDVIKKGQSDMPLITKSSLETIIDLVGKTKDVHIVQAVRQSMTENLEQVVTVVKGDDSKPFKELKPESLKELEETVHLKRQMEEIRLKMTLDVALRLEKQGIKVATGPLEEVVKALKEQESVLNEAQLKAYAPELSEEESQVYKQTMSKVTTLLNRHGDTVPQLIKSELPMTLQTIETKSSEMKDSSVVAAYESSMTEIRPDLGDRIEKTFDQIGPLLEELALPKTESNRKSVEILARNEMAITEESILAIELVQEKIDMITEKMNPVVVIKMIQAGINPIDLDVDELLSFMKAYEIETNLATEEKISQMIHRLDQADTLTSSERTSLMAIYRTFDTVVRSKGTATGFLVKNHLPLTVNQLFEAAKYIRKTNGNHPLIQADINDDFGPLQKVANSDANIREQVTPAVGLKSELMTLRIEAFVGKLAQTSGKELVVGLEVSTLRDMPLEALTTLVKDWAPTMTLGESIERQTDQYMNFIKNNPEVLKTFVDQQIPMTFENFSQAMALNEEPFALINDLERMVEGLRDGSVKEAVMEKMTESLTGILKGEQPYESLKTVMDEIENLIQDSPVTEDATVYKAGQSAKATLNHLQMVQVTEDYYQIPVMMDGQMTQLNMFFMNEKSHVDTSADEVKVLMSFSTAHMGRVQALVAVEGNQARLSIQAEHSEDRDLLEKVEREFVQVLEASHFTLAAITYESFDIKEPVEFTQRPQTPVTRLNHNGHIDWTI